MNDSLLLAFFSLYPIGFLCMAAGYLLLVRNVWHRPDRKEQIKLIFTSGKPQEWQRKPRAGSILILVGAICGLVGSLGMLAAISF
jgi:hypothetical protein